jgi:hypothetical protein
MTSMNFGRIPSWTGVVFGGAGLIILTIAGLLGVKQHYRLATYLPVDAQITQSRVESHRGSKGNTTYSPIIFYAYTVQDQPHQSDRVAAVGNFSSSGDWAWRMHSQYPVGAQTTAWYSPQDPSSAFLNREPQIFPHFMALFASIFVSIGACMFFQSARNRHPPAPPTPRRDGLFQLPEQGKIRRKFWFYTALTLAWYGFIALIICDCMAINEYHFNLFSLIAGVVGAALGLIGVVKSRQWWKLKHDFLDAELCANCQRFVPGESIQFRLRQGIERPLQIQEISLGAVCLRSDRINNGGRITYSTSEGKSIWEKLEVNHAYAAGGQLAGEIKLTLPSDIDPTSPPKSSTYPLFDWSIVLKVTTEGEPELNVRFPIIVETKN